MKYSVFSGAEGQDPLGLGLHAAVNSADPVATALAALGEAAVEWDAAPLAETNRVTFALIGAVKAYARARKGGG